jgi:sulfate permease, SulP family
MSARAARARAGERRGRAREWLSELSGGLGDWGLLIPIAIAFVTINGLNATAVFAGAGLSYIATALYFRVPIPVQPLKAFAAAAIALELTASEIAAGALLMAAAMSVLAVTGLAGWLADRFPLVLVRGIQASVALLLVKAAVELAERGNWAGLPGIDPAVGLAMGAAACAALFAARSLRLPATLLVLGAGAVVGLAVGGVPGGVHAGPESISLSIPAGAEFATALTALVIAQLPLTFGNSVVATADAERSYFGARAARVRPNRLAASIAALNLAAGATHGMPTCHGAGGVTAHYRLGARHAISTISAGAVLVALGIAFGASLPVLLLVIAPGALAGMLLFVAVEHGLLAASLERLPDRALAAGVGLVTLASGNLAIGFGAGVAALLVRGGWHRLSGRRAESRPARTPAPRLG